MTTNQKRKTPLSQLIASVTESDVDFRKAIAMRTVRSGQVIATSDELRSKLFILMNGRAQLVVQNKEGRRMMLSRLGPGAVFGDGSMINQADPSSTFAEALEDSTIWILPESHARAMTERYPIIGWGMLQTFGRRLRQVEDRLEEVATRSCLSVWPSCCWTCPPAPIRAQSAPAISRWPTCWAPTARPSARSCEGSKQTAWWNWVIDAYT